VRTLFLNIVSVDVRESEKLEELRRSAYESCLAQSGMEAESISPFIGTTSSTLKFIKLME
jgi:hypothetical protein